MTHLPPRPSEYYMRNFDTFEIIEGQTLRRFKRLRSTATTTTYLVRRPTERDLDGNCDMYVHETSDRVRCVCVCTPALIPMRSHRCVRRHSPINVECSMTREKSESYAKHPGVYYYRHTQKPVAGLWRLIDAEGFPHSNLCVETYQMK
jgi:hypothetical protein